MVIFLLICIIMILGYLIVLGRDTRNQIIDANIREARIMANTGMHRFSEALLEHDKQKRTYSDEIRQGDRK